MKSHPWRPSKPVSRQFSVKPVNHTIASKENDDCPNEEEMEKDIREQVDVTAPVKRKRACTDKTKKRKLETIEKEAEAEAEAKNDDECDSTNETESGKDDKEKQQQKKKNVTKKQSATATTASSNGLNGGMARARRLVSNNTTSQTAYMCL